MYFILLDLHQICISIKLECLYYLHHWICYTLTQHPIYVWQFVFIQITLYVIGRYMLCNTYFIPCEHWMQTIAPLHLHCSLVLIWDNSKLIGTNLTVSSPARHRRHSQCPEAYQNRNHTCLPMLQCNVRCFCDESDEIEDEFTNRTVAKPYWPCRKTHSFILRRLTD